MVTGVNDRLLIEGSDTPVDINVNNWFKIYNQKVEYAINDH